MQRLHVPPPQWRQLFSPGGCEFLEIKIPSQNFLLQIGIGNPYSEEYRRRDRRYRLRPTRIAPALPAEFPFALLSYRGESSLFFGDQGSLQWENGATLRLGPAEIAWVYPNVSCRWAQPPAIFLQAEVCSPIFTLAIPGGAICEYAELEVVLPPFLAGKGRISHIITHRLTAEFAAHYLRGFSPF